MSNKQNSYMGWKLVVSVTRLQLGSTGCVRQNENPTEFKIVNEPLLVQKQMLHQQKALDLSYLELEGQACSLKKVK